MGGAPGRLVAGLGLSSGRADGRLVLLSPHLMARVDGRRAGRQLSEDSNAFTFAITWKASAT